VCHPQQLANEGLKVVNSLISRVYLQKQQQQQQQQRHLVHSPGSLTPQQLDAGKSESKVYSSSNNS
jgi:hypothetical protein